MNRAVVTRALYIVSGALLLYVLYAHVSAWRRGAEYRATPVIVTFASDAAMSAELSLETSPGLTAGREGGVFRVRGACERAGARVALLGRPTRLSPSRARVRYRVRTPAPVDLMAGIEGAAGDRHELRFGTAMETNGHAELRFVGDLAAVGDRVQGDRILARTRMADVETAPDVLPREVLLALEPDVANAIGAVDGVVARSIGMLWSKATLVRPVFSITCRDAAPAVDLELTEVAWEPFWRDTFALDIDDRFNGAVFDTSWRVTKPLGDDIARVETEIGKGLMVRAKSTHVLAPTQVFGLVSPRMRAESFHAAIEVEVDRLAHGSFFIGVANPYLALPFFRMLDVGVTERDGKLVPFTSGHFELDGQAAFRLHERALPALPPASGKVTLELDYDAPSRRASASLNGTELWAGGVPLQPYEDLTFHVGMNADAPGSEMALRVTRVVFTRRK